ncbi:N-6 DNA methylase [Flavobacterium sp. P21]|uniref:restriction endonuclease subunit S n=1 Tax=Flavobacterium sp. P21 TaxID=3423948 RepID=UPI003D66603D
MREYIIENDILEMVISVPSELLIETNIPLSILVINKNKKDKGIVYMVDASNYVTIIKKEKQLAYKELILLIKSKACNDSQVFISNEEIINNDFSLTPSRYLGLNQVIELESTHQLMKFGYLAPTVSRNRTKKPETGKFVRIRDLKDSNLEYSLTLETIQDSEIPNNAQKIEESCLLITLRGKNIKPTYFKFEEEPIYISNDIVALKVEESIIDIEYLINELYSEYFLKQIESYRTGIAIPILKKSDLLNSNIIVPSLEEQKAKIKGVKEAFIQSQKKELELKQELLGFKDESFREFASIKHSFRQYLNALQSNVAGTKKFITNNEGNSISLDMVYSKNLNKTFGEHLSSLEGTIQSMAKMLSSFEDTKESSSASRVNLATLITEAQNRFKNTDVFTFEEVNIDTDSFTMFDDRVLDPIVSFNEDDFYRLYSNIVSNAMDHGFKDNTKKYSIRTAISFDDKEKNVF